MNLSRGTIIMYLIWLHMLRIAGGSIREAIQGSREVWSKNGGCCMRLSPENFKMCLTMKRHVLPVSNLGFKSISCQCDANPVTTGVRTQTRWLQTFRQCLLTRVERKDNRNSELFRACADGNLVLVKRIILQYPGNIHIKDSYDRIPVMAAASFGKADVFNFLSCHTCKWNALDQYNDNILHCASMGGSTDIVKLLLSLNHYYINSRGRYRRTPVHMAIRFGHTDAAKLLIQADCNLKLIDKLCSNILHLACKSRNIVTLKYVLALDLFSLESRQLDGLTPLLVAARYGFLEGCDYLIEEGANVSATDRRGDFLLHQVLKKIIKSKRDGHKLFKHLLSKGYANATKDMEGYLRMTPLLVAALNGDLEIFKLLIDAGCNPNAVDESGETVLHLATHGGHYAMVEYILQRGYVSPNTRERHTGRTALIAAANHGFVEIFNLLMRKGCNITVRDNQNFNIVHWACIGGRVKMIQHILSIRNLELDIRGAHGYTPLMCAVDHGHVEAFQLMRLEGCSTAKRDNDGNTILHMASLKGQTNMVKLFIKLKIAQLYSKAKNSKGKTPMQIAETKGFTEIVVILQDF